MKFNNEYKSRFRILKKGRVALCISAITSNLLIAAPITNELPTNPNVVSGNVSINTSGNTMNVNQSTNKGIINWGSFNIGSANTVNFNQPNVTSTTLNRVVGDNVSQIAGNLNANGKVVLINPNGVIFEEGSKVDVGAITASTMNISNENFLNDNVQFTRDSNVGKIINKGNITAKEKGYVALLAPEIINEGVISAKLGTVALASGDKVTLDFKGDGVLKVEVEKSTIDTLIENRQLIKAEGGIVYLSTKAASDLQNAFVSNKGTISASSMEEVGGKIVLLGKTIKNEGTIEAKGKTGGGEILIGGDWQGTNSQTYTPAQKVTLSETSVIDASATQSGNGGKVVVWSDVKDSKSVTEVNGTILAKGATKSDAGGKIETSGHTLNVSNTTNIQTQGGLWLLDPTTVTIDSGSGAVGNQNVGASVIATTLGNNNSVTILSDTWITIASNITVATANTSTLELRAGTTITQDANVSVSTNGGNVNYISNYSNNTTSATGGIVLNSSSSITTNGGAINLGTSSNYAIGAVTDTSGSNVYSGVQLYNSSLNAGTGDISVYGKSTYTAGDFGIGVWIGAGTTVIGGNITLIGYGSASNTNNVNYGFVLNNATLTASGNLSVTGTGGGTGASNTNDCGIFTNSATLTTTGSGTITLTGTVGGGTVGTNNNFAVRLISSNFGNGSQTGNVILNGNSIDSSGSTINTSGTVTIAPLGTSFYSGGFNYPLTVNSRATGLMIGKTGNTADITIGSATSIAGPITVYGGNISVNAGLTSTASGAAINLQGTGWIKQASNVSVTTNAGAVNYISNYGNNTTSAQGGIVLNSTSSITTNGGAINLGTSSNYAIGAVTDTSGSNVYSGVLLYNSTLNAGTGDISVYGKSTYTAGDNGIGIWFNSGTVNGGNITLIGYGSASNTNLSNYGVGLDGTTTLTASGNLSVMGTGGGTGASAAANRGIEMNRATLKTTSGGTITLTGIVGNGTVGTNNNYALDINSSTIGSASQSGNVVLNGDSINFMASTTTNTINTSGTVTIAPLGTSFYSALTYPMTNLTLDSRVSGLTIGKTGNTSDITINSATSIAGFITVYGGNINVNANLTSTLSNAEILLQGTGWIKQASNVSVTTNAGAVNYISNYGNNTTSAQGGIVLNSGSSITTNGGAINLGTSSNYAIGAVTNSGTATGVYSGVLLNGSALNAGTGDISIYGTSTYTAGINGNGVYISSNGAVSGGNITIMGYGSVNNLSMYNRGVDIAANITASGALSIVGTGGGIGAGSCINDGVRIESTTTVKTTGSSAMSITGIGGGGSANTSTAGVVVYGATIQATGGGNVTITGNGGGATGDYGIGVTFYNSALVSASGIGNITITGTGALGGSNYADGVLFTDSSSIYTANGSLTIVGTRGNNSGSSFGLATFSGLSLGNNSQTGNIVLTSNEFSLGGINTVNTSGTVTINSTSSSFATAFNSTNLTLDSRVSGLTIGKTGNTADITIGSATSIAGPITVYGGNISVNAGLTSTASGAAINLQGTGWIKQASNVSVTTNAGAVNYISNYGNNTTSAQGGIVLNSTSSITTNGGAINLGTSSNYAIGAVTDTSGSNVYSGVLLYNSTLNAGTGDISVYGKSTYTAGDNGIGIWFNSGTVNGGNITLIGYGSASNTNLSNYGVGLDGTTTLTASGNLSVMGTGGGTGASAAANRGIEMNRATLKTTSGGTITLTGIVGNGTVGTNNNYALDINSSTIGSASQSGNVVLNGDSINFMASTTTNTINTSGTVTIAPLGTSFYSALTYPMTNLTLDSRVSGLTIGKTGNTSDITINSATSIAGFITVYGGNINVNANLTSTLSNAEILLKATNSILISGGTSSSSKRTIQTNNGNIVFWADSDSDSSGRINLANYTTLNSANGSTSSNLSGGGKIILAGGSDNGTNGGVSGDNLPDGYAFGTGDSDSAGSGIQLGSVGTTPTIGNIDIYSGGGNIRILGASYTGAMSNYNQAHGIFSNGGLIINSGTGTIQLDGIGNVTTAGGYVTGIGFNFSGPSTANSSQIISSNTTSSAISIIGKSNSGSASSYNLAGIYMGWGNSTADTLSINATGIGGGIFVGGTRTEANSASGKGLNMTGTSFLANGGSITIESALGNDLRLGASGENVKIGTVTANAANDITIRGDNYQIDSAVSINTTGNVVFESTNSSWLSSFSLSSSTFTFSNTPSSLRVGKITNTQSVIFAEDITVNGPITVYGSGLNSISINNKLEATNSTITLTGTSNIIDGASGYLVANNLLLLGGTVTLDNSSNNVGTIAANNISSLTYVNSSALTIGTISSTNGVTSTGNVSIQTLNGNLTVSKNISTNSTASSAVILNASKNSSSGTSSGGDIIVSGGNITVGSGGRATLYTGSISGSTGVTSLVGSGSGKFRYNSDETTTNYTTALGSGIYAVYREQPTITVAINSASITYGDVLPTHSFSLGSSSVNGDTYAQSIITDAVVSVGGSQSTIGNYTAGTHTLSSSSILTSGLGYAVNSSITNGTLTVAKKDITISGLTSSNKIYDGTTNAIVNGTAVFGTETAGSGTTLDGKVYTNDIVSLSGTAIGTFNSKDVASATTVTFSGLSLTGADAGNYTLIAHSTVSNSITKTNLTVIANNDAKFVTTSDVSGYQGVSYSGFVGGEDSTTAGLTGTLNIARSNVSTNSAGTYNGVLIASGLSANNYNISYTAGNYTIVGSNQLLVNVNDVSNTYGTTTSYNITSAQYWDPNANSGAGGVVNLTGITSNGSNNFTISDGVGGVATFTLAEENAAYSTANKLKVGSYQLGTIGTVTENSANFSNVITVVGTHQVNQQSLSASTTGGVSKIYDGTTSMNGVTLGLSTLQTNDIVTVNGTGTFSDKNVGTNLSYTISNMILSGADAENYYLSAGSSFSGSNGVITQKVLTASLIGIISKVYDGTTTSSLTSSNYSLNGFVSGEGASVSQISGIYNSKDVLIATNVTASLNSSDFNADSGTLLSNYVLPTTAIGNATISAKTVTLSANKTYDGTTSLNGYVTINTGIGSETLNYSGATANDSHVATANKYINAIILLNGSNGGLASNYELPTLNSTNASVTISARTLTPTISNTGVTKVYDGTINAPTRFAPTYTFGGLVSGDIVANLNYTSASYDSANVNTASKVTVSGLSINGITGSNNSASSDYVLDATSKDVVANITKTNLTVIANNDAKFVTTSDVSGYQGVSYSGFVGGEDSTTAGLTGTLNIARSNVSTNSAGTYNGVLIASGLSANNYNISYTAGNYTIVGSNQLLVNVNDVSNTYGTTTSYNITSAQYWDPNANSGAGGVVNLTGITSNGSNNFTISDGVGGVATFTLAEENAAYSTANKLKVGSYQLGTIGTVTENSANFSNVITVVGTHQVNQQSLSASTTGGVSKIYDGTTSMNGVTLGLSTLQTNDIVTVNGTGTFSDKNVGTNLSYTISNMILSGADAGNYYLTGITSFNGNNGEIIAKTLNISYTGINKVYDGNTIATVNTTDNRVSGDIFTINSTNTFSDKNVGTSKTVAISGVTLSGADALNYVVSSNIGTTTADITKLDTVTWIGGSSGNWFDPANWAGGAVPDLSNVSNVIIPAGVVVSFDTSGAISPADTSSPVNINSLGTSGSLTISNGFLNVANNVQLDSLTQNGGSLGIGTELAVNNLTQNGGNITANNLTVTNSFVQTNSSGSISLNGDATINQNSGNLILGNITTNGQLNATANTGNIVQTANTVLNITGNSSFNTTGNIILDGNNDFQSTVNASGKNITINDSVGGIELGNITSSETLNINSTGGNVTQKDNTVIDVAGIANLNASNGSTKYDISLDGKNNDFKNTVNADGKNITLEDKNQLTKGTINATGTKNIFISGVKEVTSQPIVIPKVPLILPEIGSSKFVVIEGVTGAYIDNNLSKNASSNSLLQGISNTSTSKNEDLSSKKVISDNSLNIQEQNNSNILFDGTVIGSTQSGGNIKVIVIQGSSNSNSPITLLINVKAFEGFNFTIPKNIITKVYPDDSVKLSVKNISKSNGTNLPSWISFDSATMSFSAKNIPADGLPLKVNITLTDGKIDKNIEVIIK